MSTIRGRFASREAAAPALAALVAAGVSKDQIRVWNVLPPAGGEPRSGARTAGAITGGLLGGVGGLVVGAVVGDLVDAAGGQASAPAPRGGGVRVVVEVPAGGPDAAGILEAHGATGVA